MTNELMNRIRLLPLNRVPKFNSFVNWAVLAYFATVGLSLALNYLEIRNLTVSQLDFNNPSPYIDIYFMALYVCAALVSLQSLILFTTTREPIFQSYCFYILAINVQIFFYEELYLILDLNLPEPWRFNMRQSTGVLAVALIFQFARLLLDTRSSRLDMLLKISISLELLAAVGMQIGIQVFYLVDFFVMIITGFFLIIYSSPFRNKKNVISTIFCVSFSFNYVCFILSSLAFLRPDLFLSILPFYNNDADMTGRIIWVGGLTMEAVFMSLAAYYYYRNLKSKSVELTDLSTQQARAIEKAKLKLSNMEARIGQSQPRNNKIPLSSALRETITTYASEQFLDVTFLCKVMAMSQATLGRRLKEETGMTPVAYIRQVRLELAKSLIEKREVKTVGEAANAAGFLSHGHFSKHFNTAFGELPAHLFTSTKE